jgi:hypothetical protein
MGMKTVRMEPEDEKLLARLRRRTGLTTSDILKRGMKLLDESLTEKPQKTAYEIYCELDLGPGGYAIGPSTETRKAVRAAILRKHRK